MVIRILEIIYFLYFASHIPITLFIDFQALLPEHVYPQAVSLCTTDIYDIITITKTSYRFYTICFECICLLIMSAIIYFAA